MKRILALILFVLPATALAHRPSDSVVRLAVDGTHVEGRWDIAVRDLDNVLGLDENHDRLVTGRELRLAAAKIDGYTLPRLHVTADGAACSLRTTGHAVVQHSDGAYAAFVLAGDCPHTPRSVGVDYRLFFDVDPQHRGLVSVNDETIVLRAEVTHGDFTAATLGLAGLVEEGILHIWAGTDHILFLIALLLPSLLGAHTKRPVASILKVVTGFTVAHSITLALAGLGIVHLPPRLVETAIAVTVAVAALNNLRTGAEARWQVAFCLGLLHGFGFANVLGDLGMTGGRLAVTLLGFNVGVELGQAAIVLGVLPLAYAIRLSGRARRITLLGGSLAIAAIAFYWAIERFTA